MFFVPALCLAAATSQAESDQDQTPPHAKYSDEWVEVKGKNGDPQGQECYLKHVLPLSDDPTESKHIFQTSAEAQAACDADADCAVFEVTKEGKAPKKSCTDICAATEHADDPESECDNLSDVCEWNARNESNGSGCIRRGSKGGSQQGQEKSQAQQRDQKQSPEQQQRGSSNNETSRKQGNQQRRGNSNTGKSNKQGNSQRGGNSNKGTPENQNNTQQRKNSSNGISEKQDNQQRRGNSQSSQSRRGGSSNGQTGNSKKRRKDEKI